MDSGSVLLIVLFLGLLFMLFAQRRAQQRATSSVQSRLAPGLKVMTSSGLFATVVEVEDAAVVLETGPGQRSRWDRRAVIRIVEDPSAAEPAADSEPAGAAELPDADDDLPTTPPSAG